MVRARRAVIGATLALLAAVAAVLTLAGGGARDTGIDAAGLVALSGDPPFRIGLGGPLWLDRTLHGGDGAQDFAQVATDQRLEVEVLGLAKARVAQVELRVDGARQRVVAPPCDRGRCPSRLRLTLTPRLRQLHPGDHRVEVVAHDPGGHVSVQGFSVRTVERVPAVVEGEPAGKLSARTRAPHGDPRLERAAIRVLASERRSGSLARALGGARLRVIYVGDLNARGGHIGATMLVELVTPKRDVRATVPAYLPAERGSAAPYTGQRVRMDVAVLRDALIDIDLTRRRVIAFEPGPRSKSRSWSPSQAPAPAGAGDED